MIGRTDDAGEAGNTSGTFYGIGVGPGDPELMTLKATRLIAACPVIAYPVNGGGGGLARRIAGAAVPPQAEELPIHLPMLAERAPAREAYDLAAGKIATQLAAGRDVAFLCEGDPFFYGSFMYLFSRLAEDFPAEVVPGVTSLTACAAALGRPLAARSERLKVLPATLSEEVLRHELADTEAAAIIKVGRHFEKLRRILGDLGLAEGAAIVEAATREDQRITALTEVPPGERPYFSTILVYGGGEGW